MKLFGITLATLAAGLLLQLAPALLQFAVAIVAVFSLPAFLPKVTR